MDLQTSISEAMDTAGRAVLFAGITVIIALLGQFALGVELPLRPRRRIRPGGADDDARRADGPAGAALSVRRAHRAARPPRAQQRRVRRGARRARRSGRAGRHSSSATRGPARSRASRSCSRSRAPALALRLGNSDAGNNPPSSTTRQAYDLLAKGFGRGFNGPLQVVASLPHAGDTAALASIASVAARERPTSRRSRPRA